MKIDEPTLAALRRIIAEGQGTGALLTAEQVLRYTGTFNERFGPDVLSRMDGEALLKVMHGRQEGEPKCMAYWLEFKNDEEFPDRFGGIAGGAATKYGVYQRQNDGAWAWSPPLTIGFVRAGKGLDQRPGKCPSGIIGAGRWEFLVIQRPVRRRPMRRQGEGKVWHGRLPS
jgi:hypothetical protein